MTNKLHTNLLISGLGLAIGDGLLTLLRSSEWPRFVGSLTW